MGGSEDGQVGLLGVVLQKRMMAEVEERVRVFKAAAEPVPGEGDERLRAVVREAEQALAAFVYEQGEGAGKRFMLRMRRAQLRLRWVQKGWPGWMAWGLSRVWPVRWLPAVLVQEM